MATTSFNQPKAAKTPATPDRTTTNELSMSVGGIRSKNYGGVKTDGIKIRGTGAATKGVMARGPV